MFVVVVGPEPFGSRRAAALPTFGGCRVSSWLSLSHRGRPGSDPGLVVVASFFAGGGRLVAGVADHEIVYSGDEDLVDDELAVKGPPVKTAP